MLSAGLGRAGTLCAQLTWPIKVLLCRCALAGVWTCWAGSREVGLVCQCCLCGDSAAVSGCARAPWHHLLSHGAAWGRAQFSPRCWSKGHCHPTWNSPSRCTSCSPQHPEPLPSMPCCWQLQALGWQRCTALTAPGCGVLWHVPGTGSHQYPMTSSRGYRDNEQTEASLKQWDKQ